MAFNLKRYFSSSTIWLFAADHSEWPIRKSFEKNERHYHLIRCDNSNRSEIFPLEAQRIPKELFLKCNNVLTGICCAISQNAVLQYMQYIAGIAVRLSEKPFKSELRCWIELIANDCPALKILKQVLVFPNSWHGQDIADLWYSILNWAMSEWDVFWCNNSGPTNETFQIRAAIVHGSQVNLRLER